MIRQQRRRPARRVGRAVGAGLPPPLPPGALNSPASANAQPVGTWAPISGLHSRTRGQSLSLSTTPRVEGSGAAAGKHLHLPTREIFRASTAEAGQRARAPGRAAAGQ